jgi:hypothetical protein
MCACSEIYNFIFQHPVALRYYIYILSTSVNNATMIFKKYDTKIMFSTKSATLILLRCY